MNLHNYLLPLKTIVAFLTLFCILMEPSLAQEKDSSASIFQFRGSASITNNGFSFIPSFSLGEPAAIVNIAMGGKRFSFEPEFRYALEGRPWSFIFIWRYKLIQHNRFQLTLGTHLPALNFKLTTVGTNGSAREIIQTQRFFPVMELSPNFSLSKNVSLSMFYLYGRGADKELTRNTHFLSLRTNFSHISLSKDWYLRFNPQIFYLKQDSRDGFYLASGLTLGRKNFPLSLAGLMNKPIQTEIAGKNFDWNLSLVYSFDQKFLRL